MYQVRILEAAERAIDQLDRSIARRIARRIHWLAEGVETIQHESLSGELARFFKLRSGDYRIIYELDHTKEVILIHAIGHRRDIYRDR